MAELVIRVRSDGPDPAARENDVSFAANSRLILVEHAAQIMHPGNDPKNGDGLREKTGLGFEFLMRISKYHFRRLTRDTIIRKDLGTGVETTHGPDEIRVPHFIEFRLWVHDKKGRRIRRQDIHRIYGSDGREEWFGKTKLLQPDAVLSDMWDVIEARTSHRRVDKTGWPFTLTERRKWLVVPCEDFDDDRCKELTEPGYTTVPGQLPGEPARQELSRNRKHALTWRDLRASHPSMPNDADVLSRGKEITLDFEVPASMVRTRNG